MRRNSTRISNTEPRQNIIIKKQQTLHSASNGHHSSATIKHKKVYLSEDNDTNGVRDKPNRICEQHCRSDIQTSNCTAKKVVPVTRHGFKRTAQLIGDLFTTKRISLGTDRICPPADYRSKNLGKNSTDQHQILITALPRNPLEQIARRNQVRISNTELGQDTLTKTQQALQCACNGLQSSEKCGHRTDYLSVNNINGPIDTPYGRSCAQYWRSNTKFGNLIETKIEPAIRHRLRKTAQSIQCQFVTKRKKVANRLNLFSACSG